MNISNHLVCKYVQSIHSRKLETPVEVLAQVTARGIAYSIHEQLEKQVKFNKAAGKVYLEVAVIPVKDYYELLRKRNEHI